MKRINNSYLPNNRKHRGAVLVFALILLAVLSLVGVSSNRDIILQERMTGNDLDSATSLQAAETTLRIGEEFLGDCAPNESNFNGGKDGLYRIDAAPSANAEPPFWSDAAEYPSNDTSWLVSSLSKVSQNPRYMIVRRAPIAVVKDEALDVTAQAATAVPFSVIAQGYGTSVDTDSIIESVHYAHNCAK